MQNELTNFSYGSDKSEQMLKSFGEDKLEKGAKGGKLDTSHLVLKDVLVDGKTEKRWVDPNKGNKEHAPRGTKVNYKRSGVERKGTIGDVKKDGSYVIHSDNGEKHQHLPHQFEKDEDQEDGGEKPAISDHAKKTSDDALKAAMKDEKASPEMKAAAKQELEARTPKSKEDRQKQEEQPKKSVFARVKEKKELAAKGLDLNDPETKEMYEAAKDMSTKELEDIQENEKLTDKESSVIEHILREKNFVEPVERMENYEHAIKQLIAAPRANLFVYGKGGTGKAQRLTDNVLTPTGFKMMKDLKLNDEVLTPSGRRSKIIGIFPQGIKEVFKMSLSDKSEVFSCEEHLWKIWNKRRKIFEIRSLAEIINSKILTKADKNDIRKCKYQIPFLPIPVNYSIKNKLTIDPWLIGYLLGDGTLKDYTRFTVGHRDKDFIINKVKSLIPEDCIVSCYNEELGAYAIVNKDKSKRDKSSVRQEIIKLGINLGSKEKFIPEIYKTASIEDRLKLIQGLMDSDGCVDINGGCTFGVSSERLTKDLREVIKSFGKSCNYKKSNPKKATGLAARNKNYIPIPGYDIHFFLPSGFIPVTIPFKLERFLKSNKSDKIKGDKDFYKNGFGIKNIESYSFEETQCIMIDDVEHLYITNDFITTHNTYNVKKLLKEKYGDDGEYDPSKDSYGDDTYSFVFPDKVTPSALYELLYAHNGKTIVFDDADGILKDPEVINMLKKAMDTSDSRLGKDTKGGKPILLTDKATGEDIEVPSSYKFTGKIIFISNKPKEFFTADEDRRALLSRGKSMELQFTNTETKDLIKDKILDGIKKNADWKTLGDTIPTGKDGKPDTDSPEYKEFTKDVDTVFKFIEDHVDEIPEGKLNGRMIENLYQSYKYANTFNEKAPDKKKLNVDKYLGDQLLKAEQDTLQKEFIELGTYNEESINEFEKAFENIGIFDFIEKSKVVKKKEKTDLEKALEDLLN